MLDHSPNATGPHLHGRVDGRVRAQAEVGAGDVVADGGGDDAHDDAELLVLPAGLHQLQHPLVRLQAPSAGDVLAPHPGRGVPGMLTPPPAPAETGFPRTSNPPMTSSPWMLNFRTFSTIFSMQVLGSVLRRGGEMGATG